MRGDEAAGGRAVGEGDTTSRAFQEYQTWPHTAPGDGLESSSPRGSAASGRRSALGHALDPPASPSGLPGTGFLRGLHVGCLNGLMRGGSGGGDGTASTSRPGSPGPAQPAFEIRGASMLSGGESPRPGTPKPGAGAERQDGHAGRPSSTGPPVYSLHARAGYAAMHRGSTSSSNSSSGGAEVPPAAGSRSPYSSPRRQQQPRPGTAAEAAATAQAGPAPSARRQLQPAGARPHTPAVVGGAASPSASSSSSARSSVSGADSSALYTTYHVPLSLAGQGSSVASAAGATLYSQHLMHLNPLFASSADSQAALSMAAAGRGQPWGGSGAGAAQQQQQQEQRRVISEAMAALSIATRAPPSPKAGGLHSSTTTPSAQLQAASNLTLVNDSRPISPGPFLSAFVSSAAGDSGSRPVSPHYFDQPPTSGSHGTEPPDGPGCSPFRPSLAPGGKAAAGGAQPGWPASSPASPTAAAAAVVVTQAAVPPVGFRTPIYNRDGKFVGWKQNSNYLKPLPGAAVAPSSAPGSPAKAASSTEQYAGVDSSAWESQPRPAVGAAPPAAAPPVQLSPRALGSEFAEYGAEPCKGFPDAENQIPGYVLGPVLGKGGFCSVRKALHELTGQTVACKIIVKGRLKDSKERDRVDRECRVMKNLSNHVAIVRLYEWIETPGYVYIMMEHCTRGSLLEYVRDKKKLTEEESVVILQQLLHAVQFCHRKDVVHRDLKLENILIDSEGHMKLIDFGLCGYYVTGKRLRCHCGSPSYAAPEIVARKDYLGPPVDVWSLGIVLFAMLAGYLPFHAKEKKQLSEKILSGVYKAPAWFSPEAADLLQRMLTLDPEQRITLEGVWAHPWVARAAQRWEPPGVGAGRIYRALTDPAAAGAILPDEAVLEQLAAEGMDPAAVRRALRMRECNDVTAAYHLMLERLQQAAKQQPPEKDFQWDFSSLARSPPKAAAPSTAGSPTRFRPGTALPVFGAKAAPPAAGQAPGQQPGQDQPFVIKAVHGGGG